MARAQRTFLISFGMALLAVMPVGAQSGTVSGKVTAAEGGGPLAGAVVRLSAGGLLAAQGKTGSDGSYRISGVTPGSYTLRVVNVGYAPRDFPNTTVSAGGAATVDAALTQAPMRLEDVSVTTVSKVEEKQTDAPAAVFTLSRQEIDERPALTVVDHLKSVPGADVAQGGLVQSNVVARGFNNIFSGALLTLIDYRYAAVPSLRVNVATFFPTTNEDIERIEFVLGPGAALYGPNAANGVLNILTRSPFTSTGTTLALEGGARAGSSYSSNAAQLSDGGAGVWRVTGRHAMRLGSKVAFKVSGNFLKGTEWRARDEAEPVDLNTTNPELGLTASDCNPATGCRDFDVKQWGGETRLDVRPDFNTEIIGTFGMTKAERLIEYTGIGAGQARNWTYSAAQLRLRHKRFFIQGFGNFSDAGETFLLRDGKPLVDNSRVWSAQFQHGFDLLNAKETVLYGLDYIVTDARTSGTINGSFEDDDGITEIGGYVHSVTRLTPKLDFVAALRVDKHSRLEKAVWSPRAAVVFKPAENQALRLTFNRAFSTPTSNNLFLDISAGRIPPSGPTTLYTVRALGVPKEGFRFRVNGGCTGGLDNLCMRSPFAAGLFPAQAATFWNAAVAAVAPVIAGLPNGAGIVTLLTNPAAPGYVPPPTTAQVPTQLRALNTTTKQFIDVEPSYVQDIERLKPTINHGVEVGYKALLGGRFQISVDGWYEKKRNFTGPLLVESPSVFLNTNATVAYLSSKLLAILTPALGAAGAAQVIQQIGVGMAGVSAATSLATTGVPLATVVPTNTPLTEREDIFLTYRNFGEIDFWGADLALDYVVGNHLAFSGSYSYVNKDYFPGAASDRPADVALNASKSKGSFSVAYHDDPGGWGLEGRFRAVKGFPVNSGVYTSAPDPNAPGRLLPIDSYGVIDLQGTWRPPVGARNMLLSLNVQNLLNKHYASFVGVPNLGRFVLTKVSYTF